MLTGQLPQLYSPSEVATALRCSEWWVKEQARRRRIPFIKSGGAYRFTREHVDEIFTLLEQRPNSASPVPASSVPRRETGRAVTATRLRARRPARSR